MGYTARFTGEITITPPLSWAEIRHPERPSLQDLEIRVHEEVTDTETGELKTITGIAVKPAYPEGKGYDMVAELQALTDAFGSHEFTGYIEAAGEGGDRWRLLVRDRKAVQVYPRITWDDE